VIVKVSTLILTYNEAANLPACLDSLSFCDDIVVVDSESTDDTVKLAKKYGARVMSRHFDNFSNQRNFGLVHGGLRHEWVLHLDADEIITPRFAEALERLEPQSGIDAYRVPSKFILFGQWLRYAGMYPAYQVRLGRRDRLRFRQVGHGQQEDLAAELVGIFPEPYLHYSFSHGMRAWLEKHIRYAEDEAGLILSQRAGSLPAARNSMLWGDATARRRAAKRWTANLLFSRPILRFIYVYCVRQGFRDGRGGLVYALMMSVYEAMIVIFVYEKLVQRRQADSDL
jgi:glycosyltransferase involved in cell wall biosynthesis